MPRRILCIASVLLGAAFVVHGLVQLNSTLTTTEASRIGLELSVGSMMLILGGVYLRQKGPK